MFEEWLGLIFGSIVLVFTYSKMVYYSSLYGKTLKEHESTLLRNQTLEDIVRRYEIQIDNSMNSIIDLQNKIKDLRIDLKETVSENKKQKRSIEDYKRKVDFLFQQIEKTI
jgi:peptidoglycan hydrolase CwlO-like protein